MAGATVAGATVAGATVAGATVAEATVPAASGSVALSGLEINNTIAASKKATGTNISSHLLLPRGDSGGASGMGSVRIDTVGPMGAGGATVVCPDCGVVRLESNPPAVSVARLDRRS